MRCQSRELATSRLISPCGESTGRAAPCSGNRKPSRWLVRVRAPLECLALSSGSPRLRRWTLASPIGARLRGEAIWLDSKRLPRRSLSTSEISHPERVGPGARLAADVPRLLTLPKLLLFGLLLFGLLFGSAVAQERHNYLAVNG